MVITTMVSIVMGGMTMAVQTAWQHTSGMEEANIQARVSLDRIKYMVGQAGLYETAGQPTTLGVKVVSHKVSIWEFPDTLVVWSGGRDGGQARLGTQSRLPLTSELLVYTVNPDDPEQLVEIAFPDDNSPIDFNDSGFDSDILALISGPDAEPVQLVDRLRVSKPQIGGGAKFGNARFQLIETPDSDEIAATAVGSSDWNALEWAQGIVSGTSGMRQANLRIELQLEPRSESSSDPNDPIAIPFFGSVSYRYVYQPSA